MTKNPVRVRFAPSPTGGLHLGGVRTVLYNYLFARQQGGTFVLRIEDTDQSRYVAGAEEYILECLKWCGISPDESVVNPGEYGPYRQSERKALYAQYAQQLVENGAAYYAWDTPEELEEMRNSLKTEANPSPQYDHQSRMSMRNSLSLPATEVEELLKAGTPYVLRIKMPEQGTLSFTDMIRGEISFDASLVDDKVLLKRDKMPTYHLAVVVDDYLMKITHAFRGEEWLPSAPVHLLLWDALGLKEHMPQWAHLPLILGPDGAKLSKRHGNKYGFPIFAMNWNDPKTGELTEGFKERGFLPEAFVNLLALLGWNDGSGQEVYGLQELVERFDMARVHHSGAAFDFEKAKWFNHQHLQLKTDDELAILLQPQVQLQLPDTVIDTQYLARVAGMVKERLSLLPDFWEQASFFFIAPQVIDLASIQGKWKDDLRNFFAAFSSELKGMQTYTEALIEESFTSLLHQYGLKKGEAMLPLRIMLVGGKFGPGVFQIAEMIGREQSAARINRALELLG